jgi:hypothetical protein
VRVLPQFTDPLLAQWQKTISSQTWADIARAELLADDSPAIVLCALVAMGCKRLVVNQDAVRLGGDIDRERNQLRADLQTALAARGPNGTQLPPEFCARHFGGEVTRG